MRLYYYPESPYKDQVLIWAAQQNLDNTARIGIADTIVAVVEKYIQENPDTPAKPSPFKLSTTGDETDEIDTTFLGQYADSLNGGKFIGPYKFPSPPVPNTLKMEPSVKRSLIAMILTRNRDYPASLGNLECKVGSWDVLFDIETRVILFANTSTTPPTVNLTGPFPFPEDKVKALYFNDEWLQYALTPNLDGFKHICKKLANDLAAALPVAPAAAALPPPPPPPRVGPGLPPPPPPPPRGVLGRGLNNAAARVAAARVAAAAARPGLPPPLPTGAPPSFAATTTGFAAPPPPPTPSTSAEYTLTNLMNNAKNNLEKIQKIACDPTTLKQIFSNGFWKNFFTSLGDIFDGNKTPDEVDTIIRILFCLTTGDNNGNDQINKNIKWIKDVGSNHSLLFKVTEYLSTNPSTDTLVYYLKVIQNMLYNRIGNTNAHTRADSLNAVLNNSLFGILKGAIEERSDKLNEEGAIKVLNGALKIVQNVGRLDSSFKNKIIEEEIGTAILVLFEKIADNPQIDKDILQSAIYAFINIAYTDVRADKTYITALLSKAIDGINIDELNFIIEKLNVLHRFAQQQTDYKIQSSGSETPVVTVIERIIGDIQSFINNEGQEITPTPQRIGFGMSSIASARTSPSPARTISSLPEEELLEGVTPLSSSYTEVAAASPAPLYAGPSRELNRTPESQIGLAPRNTYKRGNAGLPAWRPGGVTRRLGINLPRLSTPLSTPPQSPRTAQRQGEWYERLSANRSPSQRSAIARGSPTRSPQIPERVGSYTPPSGAPSIESRRTSVSTRSTKGGRRRTIRRKRRNIRHYKNGRSRRNS